MATLDPQAEEAAELNDAICPSCSDKGRIITTWKQSDSICAQWKCNSGHLWTSRSIWRDHLENYVTVYISQASEIMATLDQKTEEAIAEKIYYNGLPG